MSSFVPSSPSIRRPAFLATRDVHRIIIQDPAGTFRPNHRVVFGGQALAAATIDDDDDDDEEDDEDILDPVELPQGMEDGFSNEDLQDLTVPQLKQQLRLRGLKVSGRKQDLIDRLLPRTTTTSPSFASSTTSSSTSTSGNEDANKDPSKAQAFAAEKGKELIDVTEYLDEEDIGKNVRTWKGSNNNNSNKKDVVDAEFEKADQDDESSSSGDGKTEVWGSEARIVDDYEGRKVVVDCLSQTVVEFKGSNQSYVSASVIASRDALKPFLAGGNNNNNRTQTSAEQRVREIQSKREAASRMPVRFEDNTGLDEGDETGLYSNVVERDYSDWGKFTLTGAQISSSEVQGVLLLSDVYGAFSPDIQTLAEKIAFECQPVVVMVPDLFR